MTDEIDTTAQTDEREEFDERLDEVEDTLEYQRELIADLRERASDGDSDDSNRFGPAVTRRGVLTAGGVLGLLGLGAGTASADAQGSVGTSSDPLNTLYAEELNGGVTGGKSLTNLAGSGLSIDKSGNLKTSGGSTSKLQTSGNSLTAMEVLDGSSSVSASSDGANAPNVIGGHPSNNTGGNGVNGVTISGGGGDSASSADNTASANFATIGGGNYHEASGSNATIAGGNFNKATASNATVGGGTTNDASGSYATIPGGNNNLADGDNSFAAGRFGETNGNNGAFVWGDSSSTKAQAQATDEVRFQATGGFVIAPESDNANGLEVQDKDDNAVLTVDTVKDFIDLNGNKLTNTASINGGVTGNKSLTNIAGSGLTIDKSGNLKTSGGSSTSKLETSGNSDTAMEVIDGNSTISNNGSGESPPNVVGGHPANNSNSNSVRGVTISGGGWGLSGREHEASADFATVGGGRSNVSSAENATVAGGTNNEASGSNSAVAGGATNKAQASYATVPGGLTNRANGQYSFAAGRSADANFKDGAFVWGDSTTNKVTASAADEVVFQAGGGMTVYSDSDTANNNGVELTSGGGSWSSLSTKTAKSEIEAVNPADALERVDSLDIATWNYDAQDEDIRHMGPMAEDFYDAFGLGHDEQRISNVDADGVAFAAIQGLSEKLDDKDERIDDQQDRIEHLESKVDNKDVTLDALREALEDKDARIDDLETENERLRERVTAIESELGTGTTGGEVSADD